MLESADEQWHRPTTQPHWNESFYFNAFDADSGWACATRVGATPHAGERDGFVCLYLPDQSTAFIRTSEPLDAPPSSGIASGGIELRCLTPFRNWRIHYDGPIHHFRGPASDDDLHRTLDARTPTKRLTLDLEVSALHDAFDFDDRSVRLRPMGELLRTTVSAPPLRTLLRTCRALWALPAMMNAHHYEQAIAIRGTLRLDGKAATIRGYGQRDHSWGVRDMRVPANWRWLSCQFGETFSFNATQVDVLGMRVQGGFVVQDDRSEALQSWHHTSTRGTSSFWPDSIDLVLTAKSGHQFALEAEIITPLPVIADTDERDVLVTAARAKYRWQGHTADGMVEFMERLR